MSVDNIIAKIMADAKEEATQIEVDAKNKAELLKTQIIGQAQEKAKAVALGAKLEEEEIEKRRALIVELENRKSILAVHRKLIDKAFLLAQEKLIDLKDDEWEVLLTKYILNSCETGTEVLCVPDKDRSKYEEYFLEKINNLLKEKGKAGNLTLSSEGANFSGGVVIIGENADFDASFAAILKNLRVEIEKQVADILFDAEV